MPMTPTRSARRDAMLLQPDDIRAMTAAEAAAEFEAIRSTLDEEERNRNTATPKRNKG